jgi:hypothetical protein
MAAPENLPLGVEPSPPRCRSIAEVYELGVVTIT